MDGDRIFPHHMLYLGDRRGSYHFLQWEYPLQTVFVIDDVYVVNFIQLFSLQAHFLQALRHTPVFIDSHHFRTHQTTGSVFIIFQQVNDVTGLFYIFDVRKYFLLLVFIEFAHQVYGIVRVHIIHETFGNGLRRKKFQEFFPDVFVHFNQYIRCRFVVKEAVNEAGFLQAEVIAQFCNIRRVKIGQKCFDVFRVFLFYQAFDFVYVFFVYFHDCSCLITSH